ncbi:DUF4124 domain-containing protein [Acidovorax sp. DW039]|nr:DUF4124 domain-containing protein [Acidovorax sp. DW039]
MHKLLLLAVACTWALGAAAQWQWIDKDGRKVFSDRPPPSDIPEKSILKQPSGAARTASLPANPPAAGDTPAPASAASQSQAGAKPAATGKDKELEEKKAQAEAAEAAKKKAEDEKVARAKTENCTRARQAKASLETGRPMMHNNAQGERVYMDEAARNAEIKRANEVIASDCAR